VLFACQKTAAFVVVLPLLEWIDATPLFCHSTMVYDLLEKSGGERNIANDVGRLTRIVGEQLREVFKWAILSLSGALKDG
jgi:hypothetical protein